MLSVISLIGIIVGLCVLIFLAYKGHSIIWVAPVCAVIVAALGGLNILDAYMGDYIKGTAEYIISWFPAFFLGAVYGKLMDMTGSARSLANKLVSLIGPKFAVAAVVLPCLLMTFGGISLFVVVFVIYPMGYAIYREANLPRTLLPGCYCIWCFWNYNDLNSRDSANTKYYPYYILWDNCYGSSGYEYYCGCFNCSTGIFIS